MRPFERWLAGDKFVFNDAITFDAYVSVVARSHVTDSSTKLRFYCPTFDVKTTSHVCQPTLSRPFFVSLQSESAK